ncbi:DUF2695 domain-containing protein [Leminorella grimontii]|uniref:DUF2695 domain-containing protein n=1 Tax=Leminorella grimontii TaxID=82981 RepID=UPI0032205F8A
MAKNNEKAHQRALKNAWKQQQQEAFEADLPMTRPLFQLLFDYLDREVDTKGCDHSLTLTKRLLAERGVENAEAVIAWLNDNGGYCDCEVLFNVEEKFE